MKPLTAQERSYLEEAATALAAQPAKIRQLHAFISTALAIVGRLEGANDPTVDLLEEPLATFETVYGVAMDQGWTEIPASNVALVREAVEKILHALPMPPIPKESAEVEAVENVMARIREDWGFEKTFDLNRLWKKWEVFVEEVDVGYELSLQDFQHDLLKRDLLEEVKKNVPPRFREEMSRGLDRLDDRFYAATKEGKSRNPLSTGLWWNRVPLRIDDAV